MKSLVSIFIMAWSYGITSAQCNGKYIILKMDDIRANSSNTYNSSWQRFADSVRSYGVNSGVGLVGEDLGSASQSFKDSLSSWHNSSSFEIWHHGWDHKRLNLPPNNDNVGEFSGTPYQYQKDHFEDAMAAASTELGITMRTFGAPYNQTDNVFLDVIEENQDVKVWLYCNDASYDGMCLERGSSNLLESSTGVVSYASFLNAYNASTFPYLVLQGHPGNWDNASFEQFDQVITYLKQQGDCFILPFDYYSLVNGLDLVFEENFSNPDTVMLRHVGSADVELDQSCCGEVVITPQSTTITDSDTFQIDLASPVSLTESLPAYVKLRSSSDMLVQLVVSDGSTTSGFALERQDTLWADETDWSLLEMTMDDQSLLTEWLDPSAIIQFSLVFSPLGQALNSAIYVDYVSCGNVVANSASCRTDLDPDPCLSVFEDQFDDGQLSVSGSHLVQLDALESSCGELKLEMKSTGTLGAYKPILYNFPFPVDMTVNPKIVVRARAEGSVPLRLDLHDGTNATNGVNGRVSNTIPAGLGNWTLMEYTYSDQAFADNGVMATAITRINVQLDAANQNFSGPIYIDFLSVGEPTNIGNALGRTDLDDCDQMVGVQQEAARNADVVYPNPIGDFIHVADELKTTPYAIYDLLGVSVLRAIGDVDAQGLKPGHYLVKFQNGRSASIIKI